MQTESVHRHRTQGQALRMQRQELTACGPAMQGPGASKS